MEAGAKKICAAATFCLCRLYTGQNGKRRERKDDLYEIKKTASALMASLVLAGAVSLPALAADGDPMVIAPAL